MSSLLLLLGAALMPKTSLAVAGAVGETAREPLEQREQGSPSGTAPSGSRRGSRVEAGLGVSTTVAGASNVYLRPGPMEPELTVWASGRPFVGLRGERAGARLSYSATLQRHVLSGVTGTLHDLGLVMSFDAHESLTIESVSFAGLSAYEAGNAGTAGEAATLPLVATRSRAFGGGGGLRYDPAGSVSARAALLVTRRSSQAIFARDEATAPVEELFIEGGGLVAWRPSRPVELSAGPVMEVRLADRDHLSYRGVGLRASSHARAWKGGGVELSVRAQRNRFGGPFARSDIFIRGGVMTWQALGDRARLSLRYAYTGNGSALAAYDADRHLVLMSLSLRTPRWRR